MSKILEKLDVLKTLINSLSKISNFVVALLFYVHRKHLRSCRDGKFLTASTQISL